MEILAYEQLSYAPFNAVTGSFTYPFCNLYMVGQNYDFIAYRPMQLDNYIFADNSANTYSNFSMYNNTYQIFASSLGYAIGVLAPVGGVADLGTLAL